MLLWAFVEVLEQLLHSQSWYKVEVAFEPEFAAVGTQESAFVAVVEKLAV